MTAKFRRARAAAALLAAIALLGAGCLAPPVKPLDEAADRETLAQDEAHVWKQALANAYQLDRSGLVLDEPAVEAYLQSVAEAVAGERLAAAGLTPRVRVVANPDMNAFAFPTGTVYVHTALLARMQNEAQLAAMLSREYAHVLQRHALIKHRTDRNTGNLLATSSVLAGAVQGGGELNLLLQVSSFSSMGGYHYKLEMVADELGLELMDAAGYDLNEAPRLFELTVAYLEEVQTQRPGPALPFALTKPVHVTTRVNAYRKLIATRYVEAGADPNRLRRADVFAEQVRPVMLRQAALELDRGRFDSAATTVQRALDVEANDPRAWVLLGEARERSKSAADPEAARAAYERALALDPMHAGAHRALGLLLYRDLKQGGALSASETEARRHLVAYLRAAPDAPDVAHVQRYVDDLAEGEAE